MRSNRHDGQSVWNQWTRKLATTAAVSVVGVGFLADPATTFGQSGSNHPVRTPLPVTSTNSGFSQAIQQLMEQARREAAAGNVDAAIKTAQRARKIAEAAAPDSGASPDCSFAAADQLYREILALRPTSSHAAAIARTPSIGETTSPAPRTPVVTSSVADVRPQQPPAKTERWQPQSSSTDKVPAPIVARVIATPRSSPEDEEVYFPLDAAASTVVVPAATARAIPRPNPSFVPETSFDLSAPVETDLGLESSLSIIGGNRALKIASSSHHPLPIDEPVVPAPKRVAPEPEWAREEVPPAESVATVTRSERTETEVPRAVSQPRPLATSEAPAMERAVPSLRAYPPTVPVVKHPEPEFVEMTTLPADSKWVTPPTAPVTEAAPVVETPARLNLVTDWKGSGAVVRKERISRATTLRADGWESPAGTPTNVTRAIGTESASPAPDAADAVATTGFRSTTPGDDEETLRFHYKPLRPAPPPPSDFDDDVALQAPSVWKREGLATTTERESAETAAPASAWNQFAAWSKQRGWPATSAAIGLTAAALALAAFALALFPRERFSHK